MKKSVFFFLASVIFPLAAQEGRLLMHAKVYRTPSIGNPIQENDQPELFKPYIGGATTPYFSFSYNPTADQIYHYWVLVGYTNQEEGLQIANQIIGHLSQIPNPNPQTPLTDRKTLILEVKVFSMQRIYSDDQANRFIADNFPQSIILDSWDRGAFAITLAKGVPVKGPIDPKAENNCYIFIRYPLANGNDEVRAAAVQIATVVRGPDNIFD